MGSFSDHENKIKIREYWCKPLLNHLKVKLGLKLTYFGLPGIEALDIISWIDSLDYVIAIDCGDYSDTFDYQKAELELEKLNSILSNFERKEMITGYSLYLGYLEEVVLKGRDRNFKEFKQSRFVHIFNLDFCNSLTVPISIANDKGEITKYYKNEVIRKLLSIQSTISLNDGIGKFLMFVTIHTNFWENEAERHFQSNSQYRKYFADIEELPEDRKIERLLRYYFYDIIKDQFKVNGFIPDFLPTIIYDGIGNNRLMCFTVIGTYFKNPSATAPVNQQLGRIIKHKFICPNETGLALVNGVNSEINIDPDPVKNLINLNSYKGLWKGK